jgi:hypothetical protein
MRKRTRIRQRGKRAREIVSNEALPVRHALISEFGDHDARRSDPCLKQDAYFLVWERMR